MARGYKPGPFKDLEAREGGSGKMAVALAPCRSCGDILPITIDGKGWPNRICPIKTGCGLKEVGLNKGGSAYIFKGVTKWAAPENEAKVMTLVASIDLYPVKQSSSGWKDEPEPELEPAPDNPPKLEGGGAVKPAPELDNEIDELEEMGLGA